MPGVLQAYRHVHATVEVQLSEDGGRSLLARVEQGDLHLAIGMLRDVGPLTSRLLYPLRVLAVMSRGHPLASRRGLSIGDLAHEPLLILASGIPDAAALRGGVQGPAARSAHSAREPIAAVAHCARGSGAWHRHRPVRCAAHAFSGRDRRPAPSGASTWQLGARGLASSAVPGLLRRGVHRHARTLHEAVVPWARAPCDSGSRAASILSSPFDDRAVARSMEDRP